MKITTDINEANKILKSFTGAQFQIITYSDTFKRLAFKLYFHTIEEIIYIVGINCETMNGPFSYKNADLKITSNKNEYDIVISDTKINFTLVTSGGFSLMQGINSEFGDSFENLIKNR